MLRVVALPALLLTLAPFGSSIRPLPQPVRRQLETNGRWHRGCPVPLSGLQLLEVSVRGFDGQTQAGQLIVKRSAAGPLAGVFRRLYEVGFPIRHMRLADMYGPPGSGPRDGDESGAFSCRQAVPCLRGLRADARPGHEAVPRPLPAPGRDGGRASRERAPLDRLGLGRLLNREHEGLHALLVARALDG